MNTVPRAASAGEQAVARKATDPTALRIARAGFAARGAVYIIVGWLALLAAFTGASATDKQGALESIGQLPQGSILVGAVAAGLFAYAAWSLVRAVFDPERRGHDAKGLLTRVSYAVAGLSYAGVAFGAARFALGSGSAGKSSDASTQDWTARLLQAPFGPPLVIAIGVIFVCVAAMEFAKAYSASFLKDLRLHDLGAEVRRWVERVGRAGLAARGVVFALIGLFLIQASRQHDPSTAVGLGGALNKLAEQPYGQVLLGIVAAGLCMYGLFSLVEARYLQLKR
ncbi:MAG TPA: DUF1206 domain-containing protein [Chloroflexota bacterium]